MDFLRNHAHLAGGDTPNLANHDIRQEGKGPPHANPSQSRQGSPPRQPLSITAYHGKPSESFLIQIPYGGVFGGF
jgi:hypothetical protein